MDEASAATLNPHASGVPPLRLLLPVVASLVWAVLYAHWLFDVVVPSEAVVVASAEMSRADRRRGALPPSVERTVVRDFPSVATVAAMAHADSELALQWPVPVVDGEPLDERFPTLRAWVHPVTQSTELVPNSPGRWFGAERAGIFRWECGAGHCGVDLDGPRGQPLVAVAAGKVIRVEYAELGRDGRSGRYVRIEHDDGTLTAYMHMDEIASDVRVGVRVAAGQYLGTLGATAVFRAAPHCHFTLEILRDLTPTGHDTTNTYYLDPAPYLARARVLSEPSAAHAE